jgi:phosphonate degradation associated HDIG domain protein
VSGPTTVEELFALYEARGRANYGESVTQIDHALQCAALAVDAGASEAMIAAALFHDVGHLVADVQDDAAFDLSEIDDDHEALGARILSPILGPAVAQPVALHVTAKRWRCARDPHYLELLSPASRATLIAQGGPLSEEECLRFEAHPGFAGALVLRDWDDAGKTVGLDVGTLRDYWDLVNDLAARW